MPMVQSYCSSTTKVLEAVEIWIIFQVNGGLWYGFGVKSIQGTRDRTVEM